MLPWRTTAVAALAAVLMAACSTAAPPAGKSGSAPTTAAGPATPADPKAAHGDGAALESVPWDQVGAGWMLATWTLHPYIPGDPPPTDKSANYTLYLVDPSGDRYPITTIPNGSDGYPGASLVDWSGDGNRALLYAWGGQTTVVDLHSGEQTTVPTSGTARLNPTFTLPSGNALLRVLDNDKQPPTLERIDLTGKRELLYPTDKLGGRFSGSYLSTPDGTQLVLGSDAGLTVMGNDGTIVRTISKPRGTDTCGPVRWWDGEPGTILMSCGPSPTDQPQLWLVPFAGGTPTVLTAPNMQEGDFSAWHVKAGTFVQTAFQCGELILEKLNSDGTTSRVSVPGVDPKREIDVIGVSDDDLIARAHPSCNPGAALIDYDPTANTSTVLLGGTVNGGSVGQALLYPGQG
jgi:hypothetical protein